MPAYQLRKEGSEYQIKDTNSVVLLIVAGLIGDQERLRREGEKRFRSPKTFKELKSAFRVEPWEAWEVLDDADPKELWAESVTWIGGKEAVSVDSEPTVDRQDVPELDPIVAPELDPIVAPEPEPEAPKSMPAPPPPEEPVSDALAPLPSEPDDSNVIAFPAPQQQPVRRVHSNAQPAPVFDRGAHPEIVAAELQMRMARPEKRFRAFPWVFGGIAVVGGFLLWGVTFFVENTAAWTSERPAGPPPEQVIAQAAEFAPDAPDQVREERVTPDAPTDADALFHKKTEEMRARMSRGVVEMKGRPDDLTNALMIEMSRMRVGLLKLKAPVHAWAGRNNDLPEAAEVHMVLKNQDDLISQLGAAVLVVGKYLQAYELELTDFVVGLEDDSGIVQERHLSPKGVVAVYMNRKTMRELLLE